jgi:hypothetical protein
LKTHKSETDEEDQKIVKEKIEEFVALSRKGLLKMTKFKKQMSKQEITDLQDGGKQKSRGINPIEEFNHSLTKFGQDIIQKFKIFGEQHVEDEH